MRYGKVTHIRYTKFGTFNSKCDQFKNELKGGSRKKKLAV